MTITLAFLSLFFGLIRGRYPVELAVNGPAASVELLVDGRGVQKLQGPPWKTEIDFGPDLLPHQIVARALDARGREIARAEEWANLPHPLTKVEILLERERLETPRAAKIAWTDLKGEKPSARRLAFDGLPLTLDADGRAVLPPHDLKSLHVLTAEVDFASGRSARKEIAYGGEYGSEVSTELTAVPVRSRRGDLPPAAKLGRWLTADGKPLSVAAVEDGPGQLYLIHSPGLPTALWGIMRGTSMAREPKSMMKLGPEDRVRFATPFSQRFSASGELTDLFDVSPEIDIQKTSLLAVLLNSLDPSVLERGPMRTVDAAAVAAQEAAAENRRRAVLVVLTGSARDQSRFDAATVRRYLAALRVPLFVWCLGKPERGSAAEAWGEPIRVLRGETDLQRAYGELQDTLDSQRIVMVDGRLLPQSIALSPEAAGVELVGTKP
ncbi:MAG TPA: hypothetical protein VGP73_13815 [Thermoanaerobaculia bacterium]